MLPLSISWTVLRDLGPSWVAKRVWLEAQARLGILERRLPVAEWNFESRDWLDADAPRTADEFKASIRAQSKFFFDPDHLPKTSDPDICLKAHRVLNGEWLYFSRRWWNVGFPPDWHLNPFDETRFDYRTHWSRMSRGGSDLKFAWETSRFSVVYLLARAYAANRDEGYAEAVWRLVEDWADKNPPNRGVSWVSGQEAAVRVMAWCFGLYAFFGCASSTAERVFKLVRMIEKHGDRIAGFIEYAISQRNNHGISEAVGLFTIGTLFPQLRRAAEWRSLGRDLIVRQLPEQVYDDGSYIQHSFNYQRVLIDNLLWSFRLGELNDYNFPNDSYETLGRAVAFMLRFCDSRNGTMPNYGGNDGSLILPLTSRDYMDFRPSLQAAHYLVHGRFVFGDGPWNEMTEWICAASGANDGISSVELHGDAGANAECCTSVAADADRRNSGYLKLQGRESYGMLRTARYVDRPAQADQLHFDLWWRGENIACDAGTYLYSGELPWTNALASTSVHNTVTVDHHDQMTRAGRFLWLDWAQAESSQYQAGDFGTALDARHDGYKKLGILHRRAVLNVEDCWVVVDDLSGKGSRSTRLHWLLPDYEFAWEQDECRLWMQTAQGPFQCSLFVSDATAVSLARAGKILVGPQRDSGEQLQVRGWRSLYYGEKTPALSLAAECQSPARFITVLAPADVVVSQIHYGVINLRTGKREVLLDLKKLGVRLQG